jgi:putative transposase
MRYRRANTANASWFFTVNLAERNKSLLTENIDLLRAVMRKVKQRHPFIIEAMVILPDHLHAIWTLPEGDANYPMRWSLIKSGFSRMITKTERINASRLARRERGIWQRRYWEHQIRDETDLQRHIDYIHYNPVKHGYAGQASDWPYSSIHRYIRAGDLTLDWGGQAAPAGDFGE